MNEQLRLDQRNELAAAVADGDLHALGIVARDTVTVADLDALDHAMSADLGGLHARFSQAGLATVIRGGAVR